MDYSNPSHEGYQNTIEFFNWEHVGPSVIRIIWDTIRTYSKKFSLWHRSLAPVQIFYDHLNPVTRRTIDQSTGGKLRDRNAEESLALLEDLAHYDNKSWNDPRDFAKPVKAIYLPQNVPSTSDRRLIELENQVQCLMCMRTRSSSNLVGNSSSNPTTTNPKRRNRRRSKQPFSLEESPVKFDESFHEAWDRYKDLLRACPHHGFTELHQLDTFYNALNPADQDSLNSAASGNLLERSTQDVLTIIENKSKEDERVEEALTDPKHGEYAIKVPPPHVQKAKPPSQRNFVVHDVVSFLNAFIK
ncbi:hypothetical protein Tco_1111480 [Tanacetum coccineum]|uniref:MAK10-like protein n=1 Tax=Tanacetum coccineum TaxID=301880 RepID=A0ABQ5IP36_9ASTR